MSAAEYDDLQLRIDRDADGSYRVLAMAPDGRTVRGTFSPPMDDLELDEFVVRVGLARRRGGSQESRLAEIKELGSALFDALMKDDVAGVYRSSRDAAAERMRGLRITLRLSGSPELMRLPWEFLYKRPRFIAQSSRTPVVRALDIESAIHPQSIRLPLRVLGVVSSPTGYDGLDADSERRNLERALGRLIDAGQVELVWLERATLAELGRRIAEPDDIHVLHYIGHGAYDGATESGVLVLETPQGRAHDVSGEELGAMLQDEASLRLVVLNACEGARTSHIDPFSGVATNLVAFDIPAVIGMQFEITDDAAIAFSDSLYTGLARGLPIDAAVAPARRAIVGAMRETEFATPVLYLRSGDATLFDIVDEPADAQVVEVVTATGPSPDVDAEADRSAEPESGESGPGSPAEQSASSTIEATGEVMTGAIAEGEPGPLPEARTDSAGVAAPARQSDEDGSEIRKRDRATGALSWPADPSDAAQEETAGGAADRRSARVTFPIVAALLAAGLLTLAGVLLFIGSTGAAFDFGRLDILVPGFVLEACGLVVLGMHHLPRSGRGARSAAILYGVAAIFVVLVVIDLAVSDPFELRVATWSHFASGMALVASGLLLARAARRDDQGIAGAARTAAVLVIAAGVIVMVAQLGGYGGNGVWGLGERYPLNAIWPMGLIGIAVGYVVVTVTLLRIGRNAT